VSKPIALPAAVLQRVRGEVHAAAWFAALGEPLTDSDRADAHAYAGALGSGPLALEQARDWPQAERILKAPDWTPARTARTGTAYCSGTVKLKLRLGGAGGP
jgi:hypothetical protein